VRLSGHDAGGSSSVNSPSPVSVTISTDHSERAIQRVYSAVDTVELYEWLFQSIMYKTQPTMASPSSRRDVIKLASVVGFTGLSGCLSPTDETSPVKLLYIMLTNNVDHEQ